MAEIDLDRLQEEKAGKPHGVTYRKVRYELRPVIPGGLTDGARKVMETRKVLELASKKAKTREQLMDAIEGVENALKAFLEPFFMQASDWQRFAAENPSVYDLMAFVDAILPLYNFESGLGESQASGTSSSNDGKASRQTSSASTG